MHPTDWKKLSPTLKLNRLKQGRCKGDCIIFVSLAMLVVVGVLLSSLPYGSLPGWLSMALTFVSPSVGLYFISVNSSNMQRQIKAIQQEDWCDKASVPVLIEMFDLFLGRGYPLRTWAGEQLVCALTRKTDADPYESQTLSGLYEILTKNPSPNLGMAILYTVGHSGDNKAVPYIKRYIEQSDMKQNREAARQCLLTLQERIARKGNPEMLLRSSVNVSADQLLRSASGTIQATPEETAQLLRPTVGQDDTSKV